MRADARDVAATESEPRPLGEALDPLRERDVVDDCVADRIDAAGPLERVAPHEDAAAGGGSNARAGSVGTTHRIQALEEEEKRRDEHPLRAGRAAEAHHAADQREATCLRACRLATATAAAATRSSTSCTACRRRRTRTAASASSSTRSRS